ncbi:hypothetical protein X798_03023 [Onchocerca flexuosa]|uniref:J domain-containing protein n=1 Tax=Onchocerca flexuosa TaxID=387005 RepID=A0A238BXA7_9BILA|nr:hypothetical protein X798_03023 [Onchocerca flexuosa]
MVLSSDLGESGSQEDGRSNSKQRKTKGPSLYEILGITKDASDDDIKRAYRKLALKYHPDKNLDDDPEKTERFKEVNHAHAVLSIPTRRKMYDEYGDMGLKLMEQFGDDSAAINLAFKPWFKEDAGESDAEQGISGSTSVIVDQPEESNMLSKSTKGDENLETVEDSNENLHDHPATYPISYVNGEADPGN